jgi:hypothetical protein
MTMIVFIGRSYAHLPDKRRAKGLLFQILRRIGSFANLLLRTAMPLTASRNCGRTLLEALLATVTPVMVFKVTIRALPDTCFNWPTIPPE